MATAVVLLLSSCGDDTTDPAAEPVPTSSDVAAQATTVGANTDPVVQDIEPAVSGQVNTVEPGAGEGTEFCAQGAVLNEFDASMDYAGGPAMLQEDLTRGLELARAWVELAPDRFDARLENGIRFLSAEYEVYAANDFVADDVVADPAYAALFEDLLSEEFLSGGDIEIADELDSYCGFEPVAGRDLPLPEFSGTRLNVDDLPDACSLLDETDVEALVGPSPSSEAESGRILDFGDAFTQCTWDRTDGAEGVTSIAVTVIGADVFSNYDQELFEPEAVDDVGERAITIPSYAYATGGGTGASMVVDVGSVTVIVGAGGSVSVDLLSDQEISQNESPDLRALTEKVLEAIDL